MTIHCETLAVKICGNSAIFADKLAELPVIFQPFLFYPDWFFMTWPIQLVRALVSTSSHPYDTGIGPVVLGFAIFWWVLGFVLGHYDASSTFTAVKSSAWLPINIDKLNKLQSKGLLCQVLALPLAVLNLVFAILHRFVVYFFFWHIVIARVIGLFVTAYDWLGSDLCKMIRGTIYILMIAPAAICLTFGSLYLIGHSS